MAQTHQYGDPFTSLDPPEEWPKSGVDSTLNDSVLESNGSANTFTFSGRTGKFIMDWIAVNGVFNGMPYRQTYFDGTNTNVVFNGYLALDKTVYDSRIDPVKLRIPVIELADPKTVLDEIAVMTQGVLRDNGWLTHLDYVDIPFIIESKKSVRERSLIIGQFLFNCIQSGSQIITNILSAISDVLGLSVAIGLVELGFVAVNAMFVIKQLIKQWNDIKNLLFPKINYYKAISFKQLLTKAFASKGYTLDLGILNTWASDTYLLASQNENPGWPFQNMPFTGEMKSTNRDYGYIISEFLDGFDTMTNLRTAITGNTVHIKTRIDPYWFNPPSYTPENVLIRTIKQQANGVYQDDTANCKGTFIINYQYDLSDAHTLTKKNGDAHEVRRKLITELNPKMNLLKGIDNKEIPWAMCVRKKTGDNLEDLFGDATAQFNNYLQQIKDKINQFLGDISAGSGGSIPSSIQDILDQTPLGAILSHRDGVLKVEDDSWAIPKVVYAKQVNVFGIGMTYRIPENFKDYIGGKALYTNYYKPFSPADINSFKGQYKLVDGLKLSWSQTKYIQTQTNPFFIMNGNNCNFTFINWTENDHQATTNIKIQEPFDTNITEVEI